MVVLVLDDAGRNAAQGLFAKHPILVVILHFDAHRPLHRLADARDGQAPFLHHIALVRLVKQNGVDHHPLEVLAPDITAVPFPEWRTIHDEEAK